jgi:hypothetical protein
MRKTLGILATLIGLSVASSAQAAHHLWVFSEIFSNVDGSVQYVELFCPATGEPGLGPFTVTAGTHTFNFVTNLPSSSTANTWVLIATSNFTSLPGSVTPDYVIPANFFSTGGGTLNYASGVQIWNYGAVPTDGVQALRRDGTTGVNAPKNFAGQSGQVHVSAALPMLPTWGLIVLVGAMLLMASGLLRRREASAA